MSDQGARNFDSEVVEKSDQRLKEPEMYKVVLHNDHYTTMEFVVEILMVVFHKEVPDATRIMLDVHKKGRGVVGVYTWDVASTRATRVHRIAKEREFPLRCTVEPA
ncbi:ATP-dependent Clp protease adapter ClpS [Marispirochaeta aestuarii]|uniref:ATP-dependent Clp protease adapter protein ClpS n=1 Tax=Marispirochaeta aestuarii TaxID=1963862 RepID=A0A1Y1RYX7_9SPIO|nr:ATP-dependent Clp protease adapter ClpS [Marispirochaeta aestuarii]ORC35147.1 ATP-dependent Clp protease adapter ClpS [Marispirochaeta aestuarii]